MVPASPLFSSLALLPAPRETATCPCFPFYRFLAPFSRFFSLFFRYTPHSFCSLNFSNFCLKSIDTFRVGSKTGRFVATVFAVLMLSIHSSSVWSVASSTFKLKIGNKIQQKQMSNHIPYFESTLL
jgi:hypothetical protein